MNAEDRGPVSPAGTGPGRLFEELKRRRVIRVALVYLAAGWLVIQVAVEVFPPLNLPAWSVTLVVALTLLGFPIAIALAWAYDLGPHGVTRASSHAGAPPVSDLPAGPTETAAGLGAASTPLQDLRSVAVLPFGNLSADPDNEYFSDGITEELIGALAGIGELRVAARSSVFVYKGRQEDVREIGRALGVGTVLEGSVRKAGDRLRISVELVETAGGYHLWSESWDRKLEDVFAIQEEIARAVVEHLRVRLLRPGDGIVRQGTTDVDAYNLYLQGRFHLNRRTAASLGRAAEAFTKAVEIDPAYAPAYSGLADAHLLQERYGVVSPRQSLPEAMRAARKAVELDPTSGEAHASLAYARELVDWDVAGARREFERAIELNPRYAVAHHWYAWNLALEGRYEDALTELHEALSLEPLSLIIRTNVGSVLYFARRFDEAIERLEETLALNDSFAVAYQWLGRALLAVGRHEDAIQAQRRAARILGPDPESVASLGHALARAGRTDDARESLSRLESLSNERNVSPYWPGLVRLGLNDRDGGFGALEQALRERFDWLLFLHSDPLFDDFRDDPRFQRLAAEIDRVAGGT